MRSLPGGKGGKAAAVCLALALAVSACGGSAAAGQRSAAASPLGAAVGRVRSLPYRWLISAGALNRLSRAGLPAPLLDAYFDRLSTILIGGAGRPDPLAPEASLAADFTSASALVRALAEHKVPGDVRYLVLDIEAWPLTPAAEQRAPVASARAALAAARSAGKQLVFTPGTDLVTVLAGRRLTGKALTVGYDRLLAGPGAAASDVYEVQAQGTEGAPAESDLAASALAAARSAAPGGQVLIGLSTNPDGRRVDPADLLALVRSVPTASGFWLNVPQAGKACPRCGNARPQVGVAFLEQLAGLAA